MKLLDKQFTPSERQWKLQDRNVMLPQLGQIKLRVF